MSNRCKPRLQSFEDRVVPASFSFQLPDGTVGSGYFDTPSGLDPANEAQSFPLTDLQVTFAGLTLTAADATGPVYAEYSHAALAGVIGEFDLSGGSGAYTLLYLDTNVAGAYAAGGGFSDTPIVYDHADPQATFAFSDGVGGAISYTIPWGSVDPDLASQSLAASDFNLNIAGQNLAVASGLFTTSPMLQFANGVFQGLTFAADTSGLTDFPYTSVSASGMTATAQPKAAGEPPVAPPPRLAQVNDRAFISLDFTRTRAVIGGVGGAYEIQLVIRNPTGGLLVQTSVLINQGTTDTDVRDAVADVLGNSGLQIVRDGDVRLRILTNGNTRLGAITYDTRVPGPGGAPVADKAPTVVTQGGTASITFNGTP